MDDSQAQIEAQAQAQAPPQAASGTAPPTLSALLDNPLGNPLFTAGFGLMGVGALLSLGRSGLMRLSSFAKRQLIADLEIVSKDKSYDWFLEWMARYPKRSTRNFAVETQYRAHKNGSVETSFELVPGPGRHLVKYKGAYILVKRERSGRMMDINRGSPFETLTLSTLWTDRNVFSEMLKEAQQNAQVRTEGKTVVYTSYGPEWRPFGSPRRKRPLESVVLGDGIKERLLADLKDFMASPQWYADRGIPYRRGYLLYGPPGSGKTSVIQALAGELDYDICILNLAEQTLTDDRLNHLMNNLPGRTIVLLEDVDSAFLERKQNLGEGYTAGVTFSGLLNSLDGVASAEERIIFMTTNHPEKLDPALIRPGRVDVKELLDNATPAQIRRMYERFYGAGKGADEFVAACIERNEPISTAQLQGLFVFHKDQPEKLLELIKNI